jgi:hypothetical protein
MQHIWSKRGGIHEEIYENGEYLKDLPTKCGTNFNTSFED